MNKFNKIYNIIKQSIDLKDYKLLYKQKNGVKVGEWFVRHTDSVDWHYAHLRTDIINVKNGPGEQFYYESWETIKDYAWRFDQFTQTKWKLVQDVKTKSLYQVNSKYQYWKDDNCPFESSI